MVRSISLFAALAAVAKSCIILPDPPMITKEVLRIREVPTTLPAAGVYTLGVNFSGASGRDCVAKVTTVVRPTVCSVKVIETETTSYPCSTATTFTDPACKPGHTKTFCWRPTLLPSSGSGGKGSGGMGSGGSGGSGIGATSCVASPVVASTATSTATIFVTVTDLDTSTSVLYKNQTVTRTASTTLNLTVTTTQKTTQTVSTTVDFTVTSTQTVSTTVDLTATSTQTAPTTVDLTITSTEKVSTTVDLTVTTTETSTTTISELSTTTVTASASLSSSACPTFSPLACDKYGYLIHSKSLYRIDLSSGVASEVTASVGSSGSVNALAYNVLDNFLYGHDGGDDSIVRISVDGVSQTVATLSDGINGLIGDMDTEGNYWYATQDATTWYQHDLLPGSSTYGSVLASGTTTASNRRIFDWVYIPITGRYLWTVGTQSPDGGADLMKWSMDTHEWTIVQNYANINVNTFGALYGINNGTFYASNNDNGVIWAFDATLTQDPFRVSKGPASSNNDGARCVLNKSI